MKWLIRNKKTILVTLLLIIGVPYIFYTYGLWLLSDASPRIYNSLYPEELIDTLTSPSGVVVHLSDTVYIGKQPVVTHNDITVESHEAKRSSDGRPTAEQLGVLGDSAGIWNALFSALAFIGVIITISYQTYRDSKSEKASQLSRFQDEFYRLLDCLSRVVVEIEIRVESSGDINHGILVRGGWTMPASSQPTGDLASFPKESIKGRECFRYVYRDNPSGSMTDYSGRPDRTRDYEQLDAYFNHYFSHYFRLLYRILRYIDTNRIIGHHPDCDTIRMEYYGILKAHLSTYELLVMYYNGLLAKNHKAKALYEKSCMFDNLDVSQLLYEDERIYFRKVKNAEWLNELPKNRPQCCYGHGAIHRLKRKPLNLYVKEWFDACPPLPQLLRIKPRRPRPMSADEVILSVLSSTGKGFTFNQLKKELKNKLPLDGTLLKEHLTRLVDNEKVTSTNRKGHTYYVRVS